MLVKLALLHTKAHGFYLSTNVTLVGKHTGGSSLLLPGVATPRAVPGFINGIGFELHTSRVAGDIQKYWNPPFLPQGYMSPCYVGPKLDAQESSSMPLSCGIPPVYSGLPGAAAASGMSPSHGHGADSVPFPSWPCLRPCVGPNFTTCAPPPPPPSVAAPTAYVAITDVHGDLP